jgi:hypothetical protein
MEKSKVLWRGILAAFPVQDHDSPKFVRKLPFEVPENGGTVSVLPAAGGDNSKNGRQATARQRTGDIAESQRKNVSSSH